MGLTSVLTVGDSSNLVSIALAIGEDSGPGPTKARVEIKAESAGLDLSSPGNVTYAPNSGLRTINEPDGVVTVTWPREDIYSTATDFTVTVVCEANAQGSTEVNTEARTISGSDVVTDSATVAH